nr:hypothetical protein Itr_chr01CG08070 [Ipomoea trifida]
MNHKVKVEELTKVPGIYSSLLRGGRLLTKVAGNRGGRRRSIASRLLLRREGEEVGRDGGPRSTELPRRWSHTAVAAACYADLLDCCCPSAVGEKEKMREETEVHGCYAAGVIPPSPLCSLRRERESTGGLRSGRHCHLLRRPPPRVLGCRWCCSVLPAEKGERKREGEGEKRLRAAPSTAGLLQFIFFWWSSEEKRLRLEPRVKN